MPTDSNSEALQKESPQLEWKKTVWFIDVDDTLLDSQGTARSASAAIEELLTNVYGAEKAKAVREKYLAIYDLKLKEFRATDKQNWGTSEEMAEHARIQSRLEKDQTDIRKKWGRIREWSREAFMKIACEDLGLTVTPPLVKDAAEAYWTRLTEENTLFPGVLELVKEIKEHGRPIFVSTGSESRLILKENGQFEYDPAYSEGLRRKRMEMLKPKGINFDGVIIGDPVDKPHPEFFDKALGVAAEVMGQPVDTSGAIMIGDSFDYDCATPKNEFNFGLVAVFQKSKQATEVVDKHQINTGNIHEIVNFLRD